MLNAITRREQDGGACQTLDDLQLPQSETTDPFTGQPLLLEKQDDGWVIYSVGQNRKDDGGTCDDRADFGLAPTAQ